MTRSSTSAINGSHGMWRHTTALLPDAYGTRYQWQTTFPFPASVHSVTILIDYQNMLVNSAKEGAPIVLSLLAKLLSRRYDSVHFNLFTTDTMLPGSFDPPPGVYIHYEVQHGGKNCDIGLVVFAMKHLLSWYKRGEAVILCTGDGEFCAVADVLHSFGKGVEVGFLSLPGPSTSRRILHSGYEVGVIGGDVLSHTEGGQMRCYA
jgi:hypothetical protein